MNDKIRRAFEKLSEPAVTVAEQKAQMSLPRPTQSERAPVDMRPAKPSWRHRAKAGIGPLGGLTHAEWDRFVVPIIDKRHHLRTPPRRGPGDDPHEKALKPAMKARRAKAKKEGKSHYVDVLKRQTAPVDD